MSLGRPRILDELKRGEICALLNAGLEFHEAARYVGCTPRTIRREIAENEVFRREVHDAMLAARLAPEKLLRQAAGRNWRAAAWLLERTDPHVYARRAPTGCTADDLDAACRWLGEVALNAVSYDKQDALFNRLYAVVDEVKSQLAKRTNPRKSLSTPPTPSYDLLVTLKEMTDPLTGFRDLSTNGQKSADKSRPTSVPFDFGGTPKNPGSSAAQHGQKP